MSSVMAEILKELEAGAAKVEEDGGNFCSEHTLKPEDFKVEVDGIGMLAGLSQDNLQKLLKLSQQAKFGKGEETLLDTDVRYTHEITANKLRVTLNEEAFAKMLDDARWTLGLPYGTKLKAHLYNLLVYGPEQFFKQHQDSEKLKDMIATLVISLPFSHIGGNLVIEHNDSKYNFVTEELNPTDIKCVVFYADCQHEVEKVRQGHRIVLTYNLVLEGTAAGVNSEFCSSNLKKLLNQYFNQEQADERHKPKTLTFLLDHQYSEHGLKIRHQILQKCSWINAP